MDAIDPGDLYAAADREVYQKTLEEYDDVQAVFSNEEVE